MVVCKMVEPVDVNAVWTSFWNETHSGMKLILVSCEQPLNDENPWHGWENDKTRERRRGSEDDDNVLTVYHLIRKVLTTVTKKSSCMVKGATSRGFCYFRSILC